MKIVTLLTAAFTFCTLSMHTQASDMNLIEEIQSEKPFVCEMILIELSETTEEPILIVDQLPSDWKKEHAGLQLSLRYIDQNKIKIPGFGTFALKNRYTYDQTFDLDYTCTVETGSFALSGTSTIALGKWLVLVREPQLPASLQNQSSVSPNKKALAIRLWNQ